MGTLVTIRSLAEALPSWFGSYHEDEEYRLCSMTPFDSHQISVPHQKALSMTVESLTLIWRRVLQRSSIGVDDNFFDVGGNLQSADVLFAEIARECGRELPSATICHAPTIAALASLLEQPTLPAFPPFVQLRDGGEQPPILLAHGMGGLASFSRLATHIDTGHPIYGIQAKGIDGMEEPLDRIEDMAEFYLDSIHTLQSRGPYILIGYSFGGLVALEMAQRLSRNGGAVGLLVLVDAYPHPRYLSPGQRLRLMAQRARRHVSEVHARPARSAISYVARGIEHRLRIGRAQSRKHLQEASRLSFAQSTLRVKDKAELALAHYQPRVYRGKIKFVKSESDRYFPGDPTAVWSSLADELDVETVSGAHLDMVTTHFEGLAILLTRYIREAFRQNERESSDTQVVG